MKAVISMKLSKKHFMTFILFLLLNMFLTPNNIQYTNNVEPIEYFDRVKDTEYYDWSEAKILDQDYSFSTIYLTEKTEFKIFKNDGEVTWNKTESGKELPDITKLGKDKELIMLITNCAVNKDGEVLDVLIKIDKVIPFVNGGFVNLITNGYLQILDSQNYPAKGSKKIYGDVGKPIIFQLHANNASCDLTMIYYKHETYDYVSDSGELGNISLVNGIFNDIDISNHGQNYDNKFLKGNEGIRPNVGSSIIYYNKNRKQPLDSAYKDTYLQEIDNGIAIKSAKSNSNGLWYAHSAFVLTKDITNSTYSFSYGGLECAIDYFFASPYPYEIPSITKKASINEVTPGQSFTYDITQYIPNNYYTNLFNFSELYNNLYSNSRFTEITIKDNFDNFLEINKDTITITNEIASDVTDKFDITLNNNELVVTAKVENFDDPNFYNHTYTVHVPVTLKSDTKGIASLKNIATTISKIGDEEETNLPSNEVNVAIVYKLIVNYLKENTNEPLAESKTQNYKLNDDYITDYPTISKWELVNMPDNAKGVIIGNTIVNYYYKESIIENPDTGANIKFVIILTIPILGLIYYFKKYHKKLYKI